MKSKQVSVKFTTNWKKITLDGMILEKNQGANTTVLKIKYSDHGYPVLRAKNISKNLIDYNDLAFVNKETFEMLEQTYKPKINDVLYTNIGSLFGNAVVVNSNKPFIIAWNVFRMRPNPKIIIPNFLAYLLNYNIANIRTLNSSSTMPFVSGKELSKIQFIIPPVTEQKNIVKHLLNLETKIQNLQNQNKILEQTAQAIFQSWFVDFDGQTEFEDSELGKIPKGWSVEKLDNICNVKSGKRLPKGEKLVEHKTSHPYIRIRDLKNGTINQENLLYLEKSIFEQISKYIITSNDLYISIVGTIGLVGFVPEKLDNANLTENCAKLTDFTDVKKEFVYYFLNSQWGKNQIKKLTVGTTQLKLALHRIKDIEFILPSKPLIEKFSMTSKNIIFIVQKNYSSINYLTKIRDALLPKLMSGEIRV